MDRSSSRPRQRVQPYAIIDLTFRTNQVLEGYDSLQGAYFFA